MTPSWVQVASTEKTKHRMDTELEDLQLEFERVNAAAIVADKRAQNFDKVQISLAADDADHADDDFADYTDGDYADGAVAATFSNMSAGDWWVEAEGWGSLLRAGSQPTGVQVNYQLSNAHVYQYYHFHHLASQSADHLLNFKCKLKTDPKKHQIPSYEITVKIINFVT